MAEAEKRPVEGEEVVRAKKPATGRKAAAHTAYYGPSYIKEGTASSRVRDCLICVQKGIKDDKTQLHNHMLNKCKGLRSLAAGEAPRESLDPDLAGRAVADQV